MNRLLKPADHGKPRGALCAVFLPFLRGADGDELTPSITGCCAVGCEAEKDDHPQNHGVAVPSCSQPSAAPGDFCSGNGGTGRQAGSGVGAGAAVTLRCNVKGCCCSWGPGEFMRIDSEVREII